LSRSRSLRGRGRAWPRRRDDPLARRETAAVVNPSEGRGGSAASEYSFRVQRSQRDWIGAWTRAPSAAQASADEVRLAAATDPRSAAGMAALLENAVLGVGYGVVGAPIALRSLLHLLAPGSASHLWRTGQGHDEQDHAECSCCHSPCTMRHGFLRELRDGPEPARESVRPPVQVVVFDLLSVVLDVEAVTSRTVLIRLSTHLL
jgi:hypothetical protein